jgi:hypothetical protein
VAETDRYKALSLALIVFGLIFIVGIYPMTRIWPEGWRWVPNQPEYEGMIMGVYATLGIFMLLASRNPAEHRSLILFAAWSSIVHALIMAFQWPWSACCCSVWHQKESPHPNGRGGKR